MVACVAPKRLQKETGGNGTIIRIRVFSSAVCVCVCVRVCVCVCERERERKRAMRAIVPLFVYFTISTQGRVGRKLLASERQKKKKKIEWVRGSQGADSFCVR